jgi:hypothetical protein
VFTKFTPIEGTEVAMPMRVGEVRYENELAERELKIRITITK